MKIFTFAFALILAFSFAAFGQKTKTITAKTAVTVVEKDDKTIREKFDDLIGGIENSNVDVVTNTYQKSDETLYFNYNGTVTRGWNQDRKNREARYPQAEKVKIETSDVRVTMLGKDAALLTCLWTQRQDYENAPQTASGRMTLVFRKFGGEWKAIHLHTSPDNTPNDLKTQPVDQQTP